MNISSQKGFTIIETLVAITILMIAIAGPLTIANKGYTAALDARNQTIASNLAQEAMEEINYLKDNAWAHDNTDWLGTFSYCTSSVYCGVGLVPYGRINPGSPSAGQCDYSNPDVNDNNPFKTCTLVSSDLDLGYTYDNSISTSHSTGPSAGDIRPTPFTRYFYLTSVGSGGDQYLATVVVSWNTGTISNQVQIQELLTNYVR